MHEEHEGYEGNDPATAHSGGPRPRGRHRRPRPRKVFLAAGGLAFAAGVLGLLRIVPEPGGGPVAGASVGDGGSTGTTGYGYGDEDGDGDEDGVTDLATAAAAVPPASGGPGIGSGAGPGDTRSTSGGAASWGTDPRHTPSTSGVPRPTAPSQDLRVSPTPPPNTPDAPRTPNTPSTPGGPHTPNSPGAPRPAPTPTAVPPANHPAPPPRPTTPSPAPDNPDAPHEICVPAIGLCVDTPFTGP